jgi:hypothetical protein
MTQFLQIPVEERGLSRHQLFAKTGIIVYIKVRKVSFHDKTLQEKDKNCASRLSVFVSIRWIMVQLSRSRKFVKMQDLIACR